MAENCNISSVLSILKYNPGKTNNKLLLITYYFLIYYFLVISIQWYKYEFKRETNCCIRFGHSLWSANLLRWNDVPRREYLAENCNISSVSSLFNYYPGKTNKKLITSQSFLSSGANTNSKKKTNRCIRFWSLVTVREPVASASG